MAIESPQADQESFLRFALVGLYVGIVPVALGLLWYPFLRRLGRGGMNFVLALTVGLLAFLVVDMWEEAQETAAAAVGALDAPVLVPLVALLTMGLLIVIGHSLRRRTTPAGAAAAGAGLSDRARHRVAQSRRGAGHRRRLRPGRGRARRLPDPRLHAAQRHRGHRHRRAAGARSAARCCTSSAWRCWPVDRRFSAPGSGPLSTRPFWTTIFLAIGIGAILQVIVEVGRLIWRSQQQAGEPALTWATFGGVAAGIAVMYLTALLVAA